MKTLFVGDLHGNKKIVDLVISQNISDKVVFIGDYVDSFDRTNKDQIETLDKVLTAVEEEPDRYVGLIGNHEMSYMNSYMVCSGWSRSKQILINHYTNRIQNFLKPYVYEQNFLVSHAGVSELLLQHINKTLDQYLEEGKFYQIGQARGGRDHFGGDRGATESFF